MSNAIGIVAAFIPFFSLIAFGPFDAFGFSGTFSASERKLVNNRLGSFLHLLPDNDDKHLTWSILPN